MKPVNYFIPNPYSYQQHNYPLTGKASITERFIRLLHEIVIKNFLLAKLALLPSFTGLNYRNTLQIRQIVLLIYNNISKLNFFFWLFLKINPK